MPPRKEPKEQVIYPSSKRKVPAFKPLRPSKVPRIPTTESESSVKSTAAKKTTTSKKPTPRYELNDSDDDGMLGKRIGRELPQRVLMHL